MNYASTPLRLYDWTPVSSLFINFIDLDKKYFCSSNNQDFYFFINASVVSTNLYFKLHAMLVHLHLSTLVLLTMLCI